VSGGAHEKVECAVPLGFLLTFVQAGLDRRSEQRLLRLLRPPIRRHYLRRTQGALQVELPECRVELPRKLRTHDGKSKREPSGEEGLRKLREKRRSESKAEPRGRTLVKSIGGPPPTEASSPSAAAVLCISSRILMSVPGLMACADRHNLQHCQMARGGTRSNGVGRHHPVASGAGCNEST